MNRIIIHMLLSSEEETVYEHIKSLLSQQNQLGMQSLSFSPMRPYAKIADYGEFSISMLLPEDNFEALKKYLASYWQGEYDDDIETDKIMATLFDENVYYMNLQII